MLKTNRFWACYRSSKYSETLLLLLNIVAVRQPRRQLQRPRRGDLPGVTVTTDAQPDLRLFGQLPNHSVESEASLVAVVHPREPRRHRMLRMNHDDRALVSLVLALDRAAARRRTSLQRM